MKYSNNKKAVHTTCNIEVICIAFLFINTNVLFIVRFQLFDSDFL